MSRIDNIFVESVERGNVPLTKKFSITKWEGFMEVGEGEELPMSKKLKPSQYIVLSALVMYQGPGGVCDSTQEQLAEVLPYTRKVISQTLESLAEFRYEGKPIIERFERTSPKGRKQWVHRLLPNPLFGLYGESLKESWCVDTTHHEESWCVETTHTKEVKDTNELKNLKEGEEQSMNPMTKKEIVAYFRGLLKDKGIDQKFNYGQVYGKMKNQGIDQLFSELKNFEIKRVLEFIVEEYGNGQIKSDLIKYPLNIQVLTRKWVVEKAIQLVKKESQAKKEEQSQMNEQVVEADKRQSLAIESIMDRIKGRKTE